MRDIKFRVWDKLKEIMVTENNVNEIIDRYDNWADENKPYTREEWWPAYHIQGVFSYFNDIQYYNPLYSTGDIEDRFEIMQYTGLKDKNGKEIYEGDIVKIIVNNNIEKTCVVEYKNGIFGVMFSKQAELTAFPHFHNTTFEVIGNIYDNPELLEGEI